MIPPSARDRIRRWKAPQGTCVTLQVSEHPEHQAFDTFTEEIAPLNSGIHWQRETGKSALPGFRLRENIIYSALPLEGELGPFLAGLEAIAAPGVSWEVRHLLNRLRQPCELTLYIALQCPHCPGMVTSLISLAAASDQIRLHIIDGTMFREQARADRVMAAPCLILDKEFRWTGTVPETEILTMVLDRDPSSLGTDTLKNILEEGDADWITDQMIRADQIFDGFVGLLLHETWSVRLGAMVVVEELARQAPGLGRTLAPVLMDAFGNREIPVQGDILYALGEIGDLETKAWIRNYKETSAHRHGDLLDAAQDAMAAIDSRLS